MLPKSRCVLVLYLGAASPSQLVVRTREGSPEDERINVDILPVDTRTRSKKTRDQIFFPVEHRTGTRPRTCARPRARSSAASTRRARARGAVTTSTTSGRARRARPTTRACRPSAPRSTTQECQRLAQGPHDHHHGTTRSFPRRRCIKAARRFFSFLSRLRTPVLSGARSRLVPRAALTSCGPLAPPRFPREGFLTTIQS